MRIALLSYPFTKYGGVPRYIMELYSALRKYDVVDLLIIGPTLLDPTHPWFKLSNPLRRYPSEHAKHIKGLNYYPLIHYIDEKFNVTPRLIRKMMYDIYHICDHLMPINGLKKFLSPLIITVHDVFPITYPQCFGGLTNVFTRNMGCCEELAAVIVPSGYVKLELLKLLHVPSSKVHVAYEGVNTDIFKPRDKISARYKLGLPINKKIILSVCKEGPRENVATLLKAFSKIKRRIKDIVLVRAGLTAGGYQTKSQRLISELDLEDAVVYLPLLPERSLALLYNSADIFIHPSLDEGFGLPVLEAMASGIPVITTNRASMPEVAGGAALLVDDPLRPEEFEAKIMEVLTNHSLSEKLISRGLERALKFSWSKTAEETLKVYSKFV